MVFDLSQAASENTTGKMSADAALKEKEKAI